MSGPLPRDAGIDRDLQGPGRPPAAHAGTEPGGDGQADLALHGGPDKAVYVYPAEHYPWWQAQLGGSGFGWWQLGENLTTTGLLEADVHIGDRFRIGTAEVMVTQPRLPCYKLGARFGRSDMPKRCLASRRSGFNLRVLQEGLVAPDDGVERPSTEPNEVAVPEVKRCTSPGTLLEMRFDASSRWRPYL